MEPAKTFQRTSEKNFPRVGANSFPNCLFKQPAMFHSSETNSSLMYPLHKLECLAFRRTSHRYLDFRSKQHSSSSGFSPLTTFLWSSHFLHFAQKSLDNLFHLNGFTNSIEAALELLASFQSSGLWQHNCNPSRRIDQQRKN